MIYITGDMHGERSRFRSVRKAGIRKGDALIVCGDFGFVWNGSDSEKKLLRWIGKRRFYTLVVDGCNENHALLAEYPEKELFGGRVRQISGNLYLLSRGGVYTIGGKTVFAFGGGNSLERYDSREDDPLLLPSAGEIENAWENLAAAQNRVDLIVTHDAPAKLRQFIDMDNLDELTNLHTFLEEVSQKVEFGSWYFGKYHTDRLIPPRYHMVFTGVKKTEG